MKIRENQMMLIYLLWIALSLVSALIICCTVSYLHSHFGLNFICSSAFWAMVVVGVVSNYYDDEEN